MYISFILFFLKKILIIVSKPNFILIVQHFQIAEKVTKTGANTNINNN